MGDFWYSRIMGGRRWQCLLLALAGGLVFSSPASSGPYLSSAHGGNGTNGAQRGVMVTNGYAAGNCAHCHEQHASLGGAEPTPPTASGKQGYELFDANHTSQTVNFCYHCHDSTTTVSQNAIINQNYSYRAGGYTGGGGLPDDIKEEFSLSGGQTSVHDLGDILTAITAQSWNYNSGSNPCAACHNPHAAQKDNKGGTRGYPVSRPSLHSTDNNSWGLWGETGERMYNYSTNYNNPFYWGTSAATAQFEPDGVGTGMTAQNNGTTVTDYVTFCQDCHSIAGGLASANLGTTAVIDWTAAGNKHGLNGATVGLDIHAVNPGYNTGTFPGVNVLSCTDCHEPHGSQNDYLIREAVNGGYTYNLGTTTTTYTTVAFTGAVKDFGLLCRKCHTDDLALNHGTSVDCSQTPGAAVANGWEYVHHVSTDRPYDPWAGGGCTDCHDGTCVNAIDCSLCHKHTGTSDSWLSAPHPTGATTF